MAKRHLRLVAPATVNRTVGRPTRPPNAELRTREYLTEDEVERLMEAAKGNRWGQRDAAMLLVAYRHGLRASEVADLRLGSGRVQDGFLARPQGQAGHPQHASPTWGRATRPAEATARTGPQISLCFHVRARGAVQHGQVRSDGRASRGKREVGFIRLTRTCFAMPAATPWPTRGTTRERYKPTSATAIFSTRCATPSYRRRGSRIFGELKRCPLCPHEQTLGAPCTQLLAAPL
jgi:hypothetical protein